MWSRERTEAGTQWVAGRAEPQWALRTFARSDIYRPRDQVCGRADRCKAYDRRCTLTVFTDLNLKIWRYLPADPGHTLNSPVTSDDDPFFTPEYLKVSGRQLDYQLKKSEQAELLR